MIATHMLHDHHMHTRTCTHTHTCTCTHTHTLHDHHTHTHTQLALRCQLEHFADSATLLYQLRQFCDSVGGIANHEPGKVAYTLTQTYEAFADALPLCLEVGGVYAYIIGELTQSDSDSCLIPCRLFHPSLIPRPTLIFIHTLNF